MIKPISDDAEFKALLETCRQFGADDDTPWLVLADWLDENGFPAQAERIRFWYQCLQPVGREAWWKGKGNYDLEEEIHLLADKDLYHIWSIRADVVGLCIERFPTVMLWRIYPTWRVCLDDDRHEIRKVGFHIGPASYGEWSWRIFKLRVYQPDYAAEHVSALHDLGCFLNSDCPGMKTFCLYASEPPIQPSHPWPMRRENDELDKRTARYCRAVRLEFESRKHILTTI